MAVVDVAMYESGEHLTPVSKQQKSSQQGMAVVSVLVMVAVVSVMAAALMARQATAIRSAQADQTKTQASWLLRGELSRAQAVLHAESVREPSTRLDGSWSLPVNGQLVARVEGEPAYVFTEITDEQGKFNLRNLFSVDAIDVSEFAIFLRLCGLIEVQPQQAHQIARRVVVSLVEDERRPVGSNTSEAGTEQKKLADGAIQKLGLSQLPRQEQAPRLRALDDLLAIPGIERATVERLRPYVTVLPARTRTNANTASLQVLAASIPGLSMNRARALIDSRDSGQWFLNRGDIFNRLQMNETLRPADIPLGVTSRWFSVASALQTSRTTVLMHALVHDDKESFPQVVWLREGA